MLVLVRSGVAVASFVKPRNDWVEVALDTTGWYWGSHHVGVILVLVGSVPSTRSRGNAIIFPSVLVLLLNNTGRRSMSHSTGMWRDGSSTMMMRYGRSYSNRDASISSFPLNPAWCLS